MKPSGPTSGENPVHENKYAKLTLAVRAVPRRGAKSSRFSPRSWHSNELRVAGGGLESLPDCTLFLIRSTRPIWLRIWSTTTWGMKENKWGA